MDTADRQDTPGQDRPPTREANAKAYEAIHNRLFLVRIILTVVLAAAYLFSGASLALAGGLRVRFGEAWWAVHAVYIAVTMFGFAACMFPLSLYSGHTLEHRYALSHQGLGGWLLDYAKGLALDLVLGVIFFSVIYALLRWAAGSWWLWAAAFYVLFAVVLTTIAPVVLMPLFHKFEPLKESELTQAARKSVEEAGLRVVGVFKWGLEEKTAAGNAALAGLGRTRRIILGDTMLTRYSQDEIVAVLAHEVGHYKHADMPRLLAVGTALATAGFCAADLCLGALVRRLGFSGVDDIASFPVFMLCLFLFSLIVMPLANAYSRRREFAADAYAVRAVGSADPLVRALEKLADQNLADKEPAPWIEFLLHSHPSIGRRTARAREVEKGPA